MLTKNELKYYSSLLQKKFRILENKFIAEGRKLVEEALKSNYKAEVIFSTSSFNENNNSFFQNKLLKNSRVEVIKNIEFEKLSDTKSPQGIAGVFYQKKEDKLKKFTGNLLVALENISDPGNLGTIIRNCDWFGIKEIILDRKCAEVFNPKVLRASMGSVFHLSIFDDEDLIDSLKQAQEKKYDIVTADLNGINLYEFKRGTKTIVVFCNEANGPSEELLKITNNKITIPGKGKAESLNVASASAVILSELTK
ncbi:MAG: RNA methyltransferase [Melioribacteraceae bacterium]|nr:MAG: RNA methyltransferase [Melioribacteraceae bacterium]